MCIRDRSERERKSIFVELMQGVDFSLDIVVGGEVKSSRAFSKDVSSLGIYLGDDMSTNKFPCFFCAPHRWCSKYELVTPAYFESVRYIEREWYCERKSEIEVFKVNRNYEEFIAVSYTHLDVYKRQVLTL